VSLGEAWRFAGVFVFSLAFCVFAGLLNLALLFLVRVVVRKDWLAIGIAAVVLTTLTRSPENILVDLPIATVQVTLTLFVLIRFGLLAFATSVFLTNLINLTPITLRLSYWYAGRSLFVLLFIVALALYGFRTALAGRPVFGNLAVDD